MFSYNIIKMPSCVIKTCKNHSGYMKKCQGITFHRFPSANEVWKNDWTEIIRECRNEKDWTPTKSSVICSIHFDAKDLYTTKGGLLRVVSDAVPTKFLHEPPTSDDEQPTESTIALNASHEMSSDVEETGQDQHPSSSQSMPSQLQVPRNAEKFDFTGYCRLCASSDFDGKLINLQSDATIKELVVNMTARLHSKIDFSQEHLPTTVCAGCVKMLYTTYDFVAGIDLAQITLNNLAMKKYINQMPEKTNLGNLMDLPSTSSQQIPINKETGHNFKEKASQMPNTTTSLDKQPPSYASDLTTNVDGAIIKLETSSSLVPDTTTRVETIEIKIEPLSSFDADMITDEALDIKVEPPLSFESDRTTPVDDAEMSEPEQSMPFVPDVTIMESNNTIPSLAETNRERRLKESINKNRELIDSQRKKIKILNQTIRRLKRRNELLGNAIETLKGKIDTDIFDTLDENTIANDLFNILHQKKHKKVIIYTEAIKKFCVRLNCYSPRAYDYIRDTFNTCLPHRKTLSKWCGPTNGDPALIEKAFEEA